MRVAVLLSVLALAVAGCSDDGGGADAVTTHTCPGGQVVEVPANLSMTPESACPPRRAPSVTLGEPQPASPVVYRPVAFTWSVDPGDHAGGHSMLTSLRVSASPVPDAQLSGPASYGTEAAKKEHQNLPAEASGAYTFTAPGTYYVRAYATILHDEDPAGRDYWSAERTVVVADVSPTGVSTTVTHGAGNAAGKLTPDTVDLALGDAIVLKNDDVTEHVFTPSGCPGITEPVRVASMASSAPIVFRAPGSCTFRTDDVTPLTLTVNVAAT